MFTILFEGSKILKHRDAISEISCFMGKSFEVFVWGWGEVKLPERGRSQTKCDAGITLLILLQFLRKFCIRRQNGI